MYLCWQARNTIGSNTLIYNPKDSDKDTAVFMNYICFNHLPVYTDTVVLKRGIRVIKLLVIFGIHVYILTTGCKISVLSYDI